MKRFSITERRVNRLYSVERVAQADACQVCGSKCVGCPGKPNNGSPLSLHILVVLTSLTSFLSLLI